MQDKVNPEKTMITFITIAIVFAIIAATLWFFYDSRNWSETSGTIERINLQDVYNDPISPMSTNKRFTDYKIDLVYHYSVDNKKYTGTQFYPLLPNVFSEKAHADELLNTYSPGVTTKVFYNPSSPEQSCLITSKSISIKSYILMVIIFSIIGAIFIFGMKYFNQIFND